MILVDNKILEKALTNLKEKFDKVDQDIDTKVDKITGKGLSTNDYTNADQAAVAALGTASTKAINDFETAGAAKAVRDYVDAQKFLTSYSETDPTVPAWAKATTKPSYTKSEVGLGNVDNTSDANKPISTAAQAALDLKLDTSLKGANNGLAELDATGKVPAAQLPSYVDDVLEFAKKANFPTSGETGKIYIAQDTNLTYRWSGSAYAEISASLALGTTSGTAFRGDYGQTAYSHATSKGSAFANGLYKITTNAEGHVTAATAVVKSDITGLGIPAQDTTYTNATQSAAGLMPATDKKKLDEIEVMTESAFTTLYNRVFGE